MNVFRILLGWLIAFLLFIFSMYAFPLVENGTGMQHPSLSSMLHSGPDWTSQNEALGFIFGLFVMGILCLVLLIGIQRTRGIQQARPWYLVGIAVYLIVYVLMVLMQWNYIPGNIDAFILGYPPATAWMLTGMWFMPAYFTFLYVWKFDDWILSTEDLKEFHELVAAKRKEHGSN